MNQNQEFSRRHALKMSSCGFGYLAFSALSSMARENPLAPKATHFEAPAKRVIFLFMNGGPSHVDTFDYKPQLTRDSGKTGPGRRGGKLLGSPFAFQQHGKSGLWISELFPNLAKNVDDLCLLRGMHCDVPAHASASLQSHTGNFQFVRPSLGAWTLYGLGTENANLPGFVTLNTGAGSAQNFGSAFLPAIYQGTKVGGNASPFRRRADQELVPNIKNPKLSRNLQRKQLDLVQALNRQKLQRDVHQPEVEGVIQSFELAFRMQDAMPKLMDISKEPVETKELYGIGTQATNAFGTQCLLARRMAEAGVRFIEIGHQTWDHHFNLTNAMKSNSAQVDKPIAGLLTDLKRRDMLKDTLVIWAGEFGRTPHSQGTNGRDHNNKGYTTWMAGGGVKGGLSYGGTDEHGYEAIEGRMHIHDWHATILHLLGLDHEKLTYNYAGRDFRLTDVHGAVPKEILA
jgi:hypothetical protein